MNIKKLKRIIDSSSDEAIINNFIKEVIVQKYPDAFFILAAIGDKFFRESVDLYERTCRIIITKDSWRVEKQGDDAEDMVEPVTKLLKSNGFDDVVQEYIDNRNSQIEVAEAEKRKVGKSKGADRGVERKYGLD